MSATGRSDVRRDGDFYATPIGVTRALLARVPTLARGSVLDPCAGEGAIFDACASVVDGPRARFVGLELDDGRAAAARAKGYDVRAQHAFLGDEWPAASVVLTNPPYGDAERFIWHALGHVGELGTVAMLLRLNFLAGKKRARLWSTYAKPDVFVLDRRPSFAASVSCAGVKEGARPSCGWRVMLEPKAERPKRCPVCGVGVKVSTSDATEYAWMVWAPWATGAWHVLSWERVA